MEVDNNEHLTSHTSSKHYVERITLLNNKTTKPRELLLNDDIEPDGFAR